MITGAESPLHIKSWRNAYALFLNRWRGTAMVNAEGFTMESQCAQTMHKGWRETFLTVCNKPKPRPSGGSAGDDDMTSTACDDQFAPDPSSREAAIEAMVREVQPHEWRQGGTMRYQGHLITWGEYVQQLRLMHEAWHQAQDDLADTWDEQRTELINRPSWDDAPDWAEWLAQDESGAWQWFQGKPIAYDRQWDDVERVVPAGDGTIPAGHDWRDTLEPRPEPQSDIKTCRHCDIELRRPHVDGIPDDRCTRCDDEIKALWPEHEPAKTWWTSKTCTECGHATAAKVSDDKPVCPGCVALSYDEDSDAGSALSQSIRDLADKHPEPITAESILRAGVSHMRDRASTYDKPQGERSMAATVDAFKATTGIELNEEQGWHFMALLKLVRSQQGELRMDSYEDGAAYMALAGEAAAKDRGE